MNSASMHASKEEECLALGSVPKDLKKLAENLDKSQKITEHVADQSISI